MRQQVSLADKVAFLERPDAFVDRPTHVETVETHFAWVFLSPRFVYKLKKPIRFGLIDFREREARHAYCELEVTLNRRLAEATYLRVVPLTVSATGIALGGGEAADWVVEMRRLPGALTLATAARDGSISDTQLAQVMRKLVSFYACTPRAPWNGADYHDALRRFTASHREQLRAAGALDSDLPRKAVERICTLQAEFIDRNEALLRQRAADGRVVDAHGDLRAEHVFVTEVPQIIDCLEFSVELRWQDTAEEIGFLALDCERLGLDAVGARLLTLYRLLAADNAPEQLLHFYRSRRATARALLSAWRVPDAPDAEKWRARTRWYLAAAEESIAAACGAR